MASTAASSIAHPCPAAFDEGLSAAADPVWTEHGWALSAPAAASLVAAVLALAAAAHLVG